MRNMDIQKRILWWQPLSAAMKLTVLWRVTSVKFTTPTSTWEALLDSPSVEQQASVPWLLTSPTAVLALSFTALTLELTPLVLWEP